MRSHARVVVIGGGALGCSLLYHLTKLGWYDCVLVEKNELTAGSTWHAAGLCTHFAHNLTIMHMRAHSVRLYRSILEKETGLPVGFHGCGALRVTREPDRMDEFRHVQGIGRFAGFDFHILDPAELAEIYPPVDTTGLIGAIHEPMDGYVDPSQATNAMASGARAGGAEIYRHNAVEKIERTAAGEWLVRTAQGDITSEILVNAAGTWCREIGEMMGLDLPVVPMLHQYLVLDRIEEFCALQRELPIIRDPEESWYLRQERDGAIIGPYERGGVPWSVDGVPKDFGMELLPPDLDRVEEIVACAMARVPAAADAGIRTIVNGPITFTPDANPLIGPAHGLTNAYLMTGSSMGIMEGGGAGKFLAEWIVGGEPPMDPLAVDPARFGAWADRNYRLAKAMECFGHQFAIHYPFEERPAGRPVRETAIYKDLKPQGAVFGSVFGWERPLWFRHGEGGAEGLSFRDPGWFDAVRSECECVRDNVAIADLSVFSKFEIRGRDAFDFVGQLGANRAPHTDGRIALTHCLNPGGGVALEFTVSRVGKDHYYLTSAAAAERHDQQLLRLRTENFRHLKITNITSRVGVLGVMGPLSRTLLSGLTDAPLGSDHFPWLSVREIEIAGVAVRALRVSYVGELGWELHLPMDKMRTLYRALQDHGRMFDLGHYGAYATNALRLEKAYRAWGSDLTTERTPYESGLAQFVKTTGREFVGRDGLLSRAERTDQWCMHLLELEESACDPFYAHTVLEGDQPVGMVTSGAWGHGVNKPLALAYFRKMPSKPDDLNALILGERVPCRILREAPYDPLNTRLKN